MPGSDRSLWGANIVLDNAAYFESGGVIPWSIGSQSSALAYSNGTTDPANSGTTSMKVTKAASNAGALCVNAVDAIPAAASTAYVLTLALYTAAAGVTFNVNLEYYTAAQGFVNSVVTTTASAIQGSGSPLDNQYWTQYPPYSFTTPATTAFLRLNVQRVTGLTTGDFVFIDNVFVGRLLVPKGQLVMPQAMNRASIF